MRKTAPLRIAASAALVPFLASFVACGDTPSSSSDELSSSSQGKQVDACEELYQVSENDSWEQKLSDNAYINQEICDRATNYLKNYGRILCTEVKYNSKEDRLDVTLEFDDFNRTAYIKFRECSYKLVADDFYNAAIEDIGVWNAGSCLCKTENGKTYFRTGEAEESKKPESSSSEKSKSSSSKEPASSSSVVAEEPESSSSEDMEEPQSSSHDESSSSFTTNFNNFNPSSSTEGESSSSVEVSSSSKAVIDSISWTFSETASPLSGKTLKEYIVSTCANGDCYENFEDYDFGNLPGVSEAQGVEGKGISLTEGYFEILPWTISDDMPEGALDFYFKPSEDFNIYGNYALVGNDDARLAVYYSNGYIYFHKNKTNEVICIAAPVSMDNGWVRITAEWSAKAGKMALFIDGVLAASKELKDGSHEASSRATYTRPVNTILIGYKSYCCGIVGPLYAEGTFDNIQIRNRLIIDL